MRKDDVCAWLMWLAAALAILAMLASCAGTVNLNAREILYGAKETWLSIREGVIAQHAMNQMSDKDYEKFKADDVRFAFAYNTARKSLSNNDPAGYEQALTDLQGLILIWRAKK